jgi:mannose-6-phosphate isomerase-like protein (cupin superfamily)
MKCVKEMIKKPWGYEQIIQKNDQYVLKQIHIEPGKRLSLQYHEQKTETIFCMSDEVIVWTKRSADDTEVKKVTLKYGEAFHIEPQQIHRFTAGFKAVDLLEVSTPQLDDVVRLEDDYNRIEVSTTTTQE